MIHVTDHAMVRYLERVKGIDVESVRREIETSLSAPLVKRLIDFGDGAKCRIKAANAVFCLRGDTVITCIER